MSGFIFTFAGDDSGHVTFNFDAGATRYFVFSIIGTTRADRLRESLADVAKEFGLPGDYEFKFHSLTSRKLRRRVFECLSSADFEIWSVIVDKTTLPRPFEIMSSLEFYVFFAAEAIELIPAEKRQNAVLVLDEYGSADAIELKLRQYLKRRKVPKLFRRMSAKRSTSEPLIQIADLVSGAILRRDAKEDSEAYDYIEKKVRKLLEYKG